MELTTIKVTASRKKTNDGRAKTVPQPVQWPEVGFFPLLIPAARYVPNTPRCVLATDGEGWFVATFEDRSHRYFEWVNASTEEVIENVVLGWVELPDAAEELENMMTGYPEPPEGGTPTAPSENFPNSAGASSTPI